MAKLLAFHRTRRSVEESQCRVRRSHGFASPARWAERLATGGSVDLLSENVCVPGMARRLSGHVSKHPPQRATLAVDRPDSERTRITHGLDGLVTLGDCRNIVIHDLPGVSSDRNLHTEVPRSVVERPDEIVAE